MAEKCTICNGRFRDPKVLPCLHCFCRDCIDLLLVGKSTFHCPECGRQGQKDVTLPENGAEDLPDAYPVYHRLEISRFKDKLASGEVNTCDACARNAEPRKVAAVSFCKSCCEHICENCLKKHTSDCELSDHKVTSYEELCRTDDFTQHNEVLKLSRSQTFERFSRCTVHVHEKLSRYCFDCCKLICLTCTASDHKKHKFDLINVSAEERKGELHDKLPSLRLLQKRLAGTIADIHKARGGIEDQRQSLSMFIDNEFDRLYKTLERHKAKLQSTLTGIANGKIERLSEQQLSMEGASSELVRLEDLTEETLETATGQEFLIFYNFLQERMADTMQRCGRASTTPTETPNLAVRSSSGSYISEFFHKHMAVYCLQADPSKCTIQGSGLQSFEVFKMTEVAVHICDKNRKPCSFPQNVSATMKCAHNDATMSGEVHDSGKGFYTISFCPKLRGQHDVEVLVNDHHVRGSPFSTYVHYPPSLRGKSQGTLENVKSPRGIAIGPNGNLFVTEWNEGTIVELDQQGKYVRRFGSSGDAKSRILRHPAGIVVDKEGNVYAADAAGEQCCIVKYTPNGAQVAAVGQLGSAPCEFRSPRGLAINPTTGELYICDRDNHRIQILSTSLKFLHSMDLHDLDRHLELPSKPNDVTFDKVGNLYVADYANNCILRFASNHQYLDALSKQGSDPGCLSGPECVHMDRHGHLYVTESKNHRVSIFDSQGSFLSHFGKLGSGENELKFPMGLVTAESGFVFVCELFNNRIQVF